jgi:hypothetical protein
VLLNNICYKWLCIWLVTSKLKNILQLGPIDPARQSKALTHAWDDHTTPQDLYSITSLHTPKPYFTAKRSCYPISSPSFSVESMQAHTHVCFLVYHTRSQALLLRSLQFQDVAQWLPHVGMQGPPFPLMFCRYDVAAKVTRPLCTNQQTEPLMDPWSLATLHCVEAPIHILMLIQVKDNQN